MSENRIDQFEKLVKEQPANVLFRFSLAQALEAAGRSEEAIRHYRPCMDARSDWMMPRILLGKLMVQLGRPDEAIPLLEDALQLAMAQDHESPASELRALLQDLR